MKIKHYPKRNYSYGIIILIEESHFLPTKMAYFKDCLGIPNWSIELKMYNRKMFMFSFLAIPQFSVSSVPVISAFGKVCAFYTSKQSNALKFAQQSLEGISGVLVLFPFHASFKLGRQAQPQHKLKASPKHCVCLNVSPKEDRSVFSFNFLSLPFPQHRIKHEIKATLKHKNNS